LFFREIELFIGVSVLELVTLNRYRDLQIAYTKFVVEPIYLFIPFNKDESALNFSNRFEY